MSRWADMFAALSAGRDTPDTMRHSGHHAPRASHSGKTVSASDKRARSVAANSVRSAEERAPSPAPCDEIDPTDPEAWRDLYEERAAMRQYGGGYDRAVAERLAWGELQNRWHMRHGQRTPRRRCAGCGGAITGAALDLIDGTRVHLAAGNDCLIRYGKRWRGAATLALLDLGLKPPVGTVHDRRRA